MPKTSKPKLDQAGLTGLGIEKLVQILLDEVPHNKSLKTRLLAALAGNSGPEEVARLIDKRLDTLAKSKSYLSIAKANELAIELRGLLKNITTELAALDRYAAFQRMIKFSRVGATVEERAYEGGAKLAKLLDEVSESLVSVSLGLVPDEQVRAISLLEPLRVGDVHGVFRLALIEILCGMQKPASDAWKTVLLDKLTQKPDKANAWRSDEPIMYLQQLASRQGDLDAYVALELRKAEERRDTFAVAEMLHEAKRHAEALDWVRKPSGNMRIMYMSNGAIGVALAPSPPRALRLLEADILDALKQKEAGRAIRWEEFERTLRPDILRAHIARLDDFAEFEETDKAFALVTESPRIYDALSFLIEWPRLDLASDLVLRHLRKWDGRQYDLLRDAALALQEKFPVAATMLFRTLLDDILRRGLSAAYPHASGYYVALHQLAPKLPSDFAYQSHEKYMAEMKTKHGRKYGFWQLVPQELA